MSAEKTVSHRKRVSSFRSLSFSFSQKAFVVATVKEDLVTKSEREICKSQTVSDQEFMQNSGSILPRVVSRNQPRGIQRIVYPNVWSTGAVLPIRAGPSSSSFSSRVKSTLSGVYLQRTKAFQKSRYGKKTNIFYFIKYTLKRDRSMMMQSVVTKKVFASLAKRGGKEGVPFARTWNRQNARRGAMASRRSKTVVTKCEKKAMHFSQNVSNFFTPLLAFTKANEFEKRSERAYLEYPVRRSRFYITRALYYALMMCSMMLTFFFI
jgi:hypothetical protein